METAIPCPSKKTSLFWLNEEPAPQNTRRRCINWDWSFLVYYLCNLYCRLVWCNRGQKTGSRLGKFSYLAFYRRRGMGYLSPLSFVTRVQQCQALD